ncbi:MAG: NADP-dependent isocitrate dehydrogenase [Clostridiales bacterium]|jgi:isocitrate dehydrogenase|nr:NADP-dependent isocitrate dehydrogenase [Clostridiales bacterium]
MEKIKMTVPIVEMDGDEMTRVIWKMIKDELILPFVDLKTEYYDLGLMERDRTEDEITIESAQATRKYGVAVKCATITPNAQRMEEYKLKKMWKSPNATIRGILDGTIFRAPIMTDCIKPAISRWTKPITIARHAYGDVYRGVELRTGEPGIAQLIFTGESGKTVKQEVAQLQGPAVLQGMHNTEKSIESFAHSCFKYAIDTKQDLWFSTKDTISKIYDGAFKEIFERIYKDYEEEFKSLGLEFFYTLIDDAASRIVRSEGGFIWALKNYDGDVMSDLVSTVYGSLSMMTSVLVSPDGKYEYEAAHGTITRHYYRYLQGETPTANPIASIFAWSGGLRKRGEMDGNEPLVRFGNALEEACLATIREGIMTKDLAQMAEGVTPKVVNTEDFIKTVAEKTASLM